MNEQTHAVLGFYVRRDGMILSVWNRKYRVWGLPGGKVEPGETLHEALDREMREETGLHAWNHVPEIYTSPTYSGSGRLCHVFDLREHWQFHSSSDFCTTEPGAGIGWMAKHFLEGQDTCQIGEWFKSFFKVVKGR